MHNFNKKLKFIPPLSLYCDNTISDAFTAINEKFGMIVIVIEEGGRLCGIVTEGDLRRAILEGNSLDTALKYVMNKKPVILKFDELEDESSCDRVIEQIYRRYGSGQEQQATIPVIDEDSHVIGLVIPEMLQTRDNHNLAEKVIRSISPQVLVVGGGGYIGSVLVRLLLSKSWRVRVLDNMLYRQTSLDGIHDERLFVIRADVANINEVVEAITDIDAVVYLAEIVGDAACIYSPERALKTNYLSVTSMAYLCAYLNINRFVYTSSCSIYGGSKDPHKYLSEESELNPVSYYGRMKMMTEQMLLGILNPLFSPTILRVATVFGYSFRPRFDLVVNAFAKDAFFNKYIEVFGGNQWRPNVHVRDVTGAIIKVLEAPIEKVSRQIFNVGSTKENYTINELADLVLQVFSGVRIKQVKKSLDPRNYRVDFSKIEQTLDFHAKINVLDGLKELKSVFERAEIKDPNDCRYNNLEALK